MVKNRMCPFIKGAIWHSIMTSRLIGVVASWDFPAFEGWMVCRHHNQLNEWTTFCLPIPLLEWTACTFWSLWLAPQGRLVPMGLMSPGVQCDESRSRAAKTYGDSMFSFWRKCNDCLEIYGVKNVSGGKGKLLFKASEGSREPGWCRWLRMWVLVSDQVMISELWDVAPCRTPCSVSSLLEVLFLPLHLLPPSEGALWPKHQTKQNKTKSPNLASGPPGAGSWKAAPYKLWDKRTLWLRKPQRIGHW